MLPARWIRRRTIRIQAISAGRDSWDASLRDRPFVKACWHAIETDGTATPGEYRGDGDDDDDYDNYYGEAGDTKTAIVGGRRH